MSGSTFVLTEHLPYTRLLANTVFAIECPGPLTSTDSSPLVDTGGVFTLQPFPCVTGVHVRAHLPFLTGTHQAAGAVIQDQRHPGETHGGLLRALASPRTRLGPDQREHLWERNESVFYMLLKVSF